MLYYIFRGNILRSLQFQVSSESVNKTIPILFTIPEHKGGIISSSVHEEEMRYYLQITFFTRCFQEQKHPILFS